MNLRKSKHKMLLSIIIYKCINIMKGRNSQFTLCKNLVRLSTLFFKNKVHNLIYKLI